MGIALKNEAEMAKAGIMIDPTTGAAVPAAGLNDLRPNSNWPDELLIEYGQRALNAADTYEKQANILTRKTIVQRFRAGHALSLLKDRLKEKETWVEFQTQHNLPRTVVWEAIAVYERVVKLGLGEDDVAVYTTWMNVMIAYGVRRNPQEGIADIPAEATDTQPDASKHGKKAVAVNRKKPQPDKADDALPEEQDPGDTGEDGSDVEGQEGQPDPDLPEQDEPSVPDADMDAAAAFVAQVGSLPHAARALAMTGIKNGDKEMFQSALKEMIRAAQTILTSAEINKIVLLVTMAKKGLVFEKI
jgi:hypothetical protein